MTPREWWNDIPLKVVVLIVGVTLAIATLQAQVGLLQANKADRSAVEAMSSDIKDIKAMLCVKANPDSMCGRR